MKKIIILLAMFFIAIPSQALTIDYTKDGSAQALVSKIGFNILNANRIPQRMVFYVKPDKKVVNAVTYFRDRQIVVYGGLLTYSDNEDELAAVIAHEISHAIDSYDGVLRGFFSPVTYSLKPKKYEYKADKRAVDFVVKAGYNPLAFITIMNKIDSQPRYELFSTHPLCSRRLAAVYEYIYTKYPQYLVQNEYKDNIYYQNFLLTSKENRLQLQEKVKNNSKKRIKYL